MSKPAKTAVKEDIRSLTGAERAAIVMLALGEEHSQQIWQMMDEDEIKEVSQVMSNLGSVSSALIEKLLVDFVSDVGHRFADGLAGPPSASWPTSCRRKRSRRDHGGNSPGPARPPPCGTSWQM